MGSSRSLRRLTRGSRAAGRAGAEEAAADCLLNWLCLDRQGETELAKPPFTLENVRRGPIPPVWRPPIQRVSTLLEGDQRRDSGMAAQAGPEAIIISEAVRAALEGLFSSLLARLSYSPAGGTRGGSRSTAPAPRTWNNAEDGLSKPDARERKGRENSALLVARMPDT